LTIQTNSSDIFMLSTHDKTRIDDTRIASVRPLMIPALLEEQLPALPKHLALVESSRQKISNVLHGLDDRLVVVVGPCSIHDYYQAVAYANLLKIEEQRHYQELLIVMRVYFEKPRTTVGWKGYINDPHLDGSFAMNQGLAMARKLMIEIINLGLPVATEFLDLLSHQFISDLVTWSAIGARTTESQTHRQLASGLPCPVGFKNATDGDVKVAADAVVAAKAAHAFMGMTKMGQAAIFETRGNKDVHIILRGGKLPNYSSTDVNNACILLEASGITPQVMVDVSHANSAKNHTKQIQVANDVAAQIANGNKRILGLMIESHINEGRQELILGQALQHGVSITDACLSFNQTIPLLNTLADAVKNRRITAN
jgi:3-deoxy-7-phosphoheptulonate synthase